MPDSADVYKAGALAARLEHTGSGVRFSYHDEYLDGPGPAVASTLPRSSEPVLTPAGAVPAFFAGLLPEGRRLQALRRAVKTSADDELSLLVAVGSDTVGDVQVVASGSTPAGDRSGLVLADPAGLRFEDLLHDAGVADRPTLAGVQDKASAAMLSLPVRRRGERFILKLDPTEFPHLVRNEAYFAARARAARIPAVTTRVLTDVDARPGLLVTRFDRVAEADGTVRLIAVEDAAQAAGAWPADKYRLSFEEAASALMGLTRAPRVAASRLVEQLAFAWLTGNGDQHAKNLSVYERDPGEFMVTPAYDLPSTLFYGDQTLALTVAGKDTLTARRFMEAAATLELTPRSARRTLAAALRATADLAESIEAGALPFDRRTNAKTARTLRGRHRELADGMSRIDE
ncbi:type II toxin-antitoxin system HipA family toxin [Agromyces aerolatus]|uniref:type II toxin-antitoxin system HipA family toxin n=1 Tax=Agromyces sp. LY-1074 TaxID=3074080 RepID=UPI00286632B3|nr:MULTISPECIES: HipA domain-containing protein [unclassified Agromyces]MDR5698977.1 HipA domain-containing protein [Agromyces sp. LY-1074]MDR5705245.1 HipA domain-containing protein [Agromyces sp. LY-1358]